MYYKLPLLLLLVLCSKWAVTQQPDYEKIYSENPPAFTILNVEPTSIERPATPQKFAASVQNLYANGKPQPGFAMEFTPGLWGKKKYALNTRAYIMDSRLTAYFWQHLSLSLATSSTDSTIFGNLDPGTGLSVGGKLLVLNGRPSEKTKHKLYVLDTMLAFAAGYNAYELSFTKATIVSSFTFNQAVNKILSDTLVTNNQKNALTAIAKSIDNLIKTNSNLYLTEKEFDSVVTQLELSATVKVLPLLDKELFEEFITKNDIQTIINDTKSKLANSYQLNASQIKQYQLLIKTGEDLLNKLVEMKSDTLTMDEFNKISIDYKQKIAEMDITVERDGPKLEIAGAGMSVLPSNEWNNHVAFAKYGFWINYTHRINISKEDNLDNDKFFDFGVVARYIHNKQTSSVQIDSSNYLDFGAKVGVQIKKAKLATEYVFRYLTNKPESLDQSHTWKLTLNFEYQFTDVIGIKATFGKGFDGNSLYYDNNDKQFLGVMGLNVSLPTLTENQ